jgi:nucleotide-binding universal stress UspA family protein
MKPIKSILFATDFSDVSEYALNVAVSLAKQLDARVTVFHAYELPIYGVPDGALIATADIAAKIHTAATAALGAAVEKHKGANVVITTQLAAGNPVDEVERAAKDLKADLIVVGTHGRRGIARALLGSIAENVIRTSMVPVLAVHAPEAA